jgi:hypothetical protein
MLLSTLKTKLQTVTGTDIKSVYFDWQRYLNETRDKQYPAVLWMLDGSRFKTDMRTSTVRKTKSFTLTVYAIASFSPDTQDKITVWDTLEEQFKTYLNAMNADSGLTIENIDGIEGRYAGEGLFSADKEIGLIFRDVQLKMWC